MSYCRLSDLYPGLMYDPADLVQLVITTLLEKVVENIAVSRTIKMRLFGSHNIRPLLQLLAWKGPKKEEEEEGKTGNKMANGTS